MRLQDDIDFTTLTWVKQELDDTLRQAQQALEAYVEDSSDKSQMRFCGSYLHQVQGTLRMVELYGAAMVVEEMERLALGLLDGQIKQAEDAYTVLMRGMVQLPDYLERLQSGHRDIPIVLLPLLNDLRACRGEKLLSETSLFSPDLGAALPASASGAKAALAQPMIAANGGRLRLAFQFGLLKWFKGDDVDGNLTRLIAILDRVRGMCVQLDARRLFWIAAGGLDAVLVKGIEASVAMKLLVGRVDRELKRLIDAGESAFAAAPPNDLTKSLLYYVAQSSKPSERITELRQVYRLDKLMPSEAELKHARGALTGHNKALLETVGTAIKEDLLRVKDALDLYLRTGSGNVDDLAPQGEALHRVADTLGMLGLGVPRRVVLDQQDVLERIVRGRQPAEESALLDIAGSLLYVESSLDDHIDRLGADQREAPPPSSGFELPQAEVRKILDATTKEASANIQQAKQDIVAFIESPWDHSKIEQIPRLLDEIAGALRMLNLPEPAALLGGVVRFAEVELLRHRRVPSGDQLDLMADAIASIEFYLEAVKEGRRNRDKILDVTRRSLEALGYWPLPVEGSEDNVLAEAPAAPVSESAAPAVSSFPTFADTFTTERTQTPITQAPAEPEPALPEVAGPPSEAGAVDELIASFVHLEDRFEQTDFVAPVVAPVEPEMRSVVDIAPGDGLEALIVGESARQPLAASIHDLEGLRITTADLEAPTSESAVEVVLSAEETAELGLAPADEQTTEALDSDLDASAPQFADLTEAAVESPEPEAAFEQPPMDLVPEPEPAPFVDLTPVVAPAPIVAPPVVIPAPVAVVAPPHPSIALPDVGFHSVPSDEIDDEIREVFVEEVQDELDNLNRQYPAWKHDLGDFEKLKPVRRSFHTLKGSGRLVGALAIGEYAWKIENMLNRILDKTIQPTPAALDLLDHAIAALPGMLAALKGEGQPDANVGTIMWVADQLATGQEVWLPKSSPAPAVTAEIQPASEAGSVAATIAIADAADTTAAAPALPVPPPETTPQADRDPFSLLEEETAAAEIAEVSSEVAGDAPEVDAVVESDVVELSPLDVDPMLMEILASEVEAHLTTIRHYLGQAALDGPAPVTEELLRAVHTLNGALSMVDLPILTRVVAPLEGYLKRLRARGMAPSDEGVTALTDAANCIATVMTALESRTPAPDTSALAEHVLALRDGLPAPDHPYHGFGIQVVDEHKDDTKEAAVELEGAVGAVEARPWYEAEEEAPSAVELTEVFDASDEVAADAEVAPLGESDAVVAGLLVDEATAAEAPAGFLATDASDADALLQAESATLDDLIVDFGVVEEVHSGEPIDVDLGDLAVNLDLSAPPSESAADELSGDESIEPATEIAIDHDEQGMVDISALDAVIAHGDPEVEASLAFEPTDFESAVEVGAVAIESDSGEMPEDLAGSALDLGVDLSTELAEFAELTQSEAVDEAVSAIAHDDRTEEAPFSGEPMAEVDTEIMAEAGESIDLSDLWSAPAELPADELELPAEETAVAVADEAFAFEAVNVETAPVELDAESLPDVLDRETPLEVLDGESPLEVLDVETLPEVLEGETLPEAMDVETLPEAMDVETLPEAMDVETVPEAMDVETLPEALDVETLTEASFALPEAESAHEAPLEASETLRVDAESDYVDGGVDDSQRAHLADILDNIGADAVAAVDESTAAAETVVADATETPVGADDESPVVEVARADQAPVRAEVVPQGNVDVDPPGPLDLPDMDLDLLDIFVEEGVDILDHSDGMMARLREAPGDREPVASLQRDLHTLKGGARMAGLYPIGDLSHAMESLFEAIVHGERAASRPAIEALEKAFDRLHGMVQRVRVRQAIALPVHIIARLEAIIEGHEEEEHEAPAESGATAEPEAPTVAAVSVPDNAAPLVEPESIAPAAEPEVTPGRRTIPARPSAKGVQRRTQLDEDEAAARAAQQELIRVRADLLDNLVNFAGEVSIYRSRLEAQMGGFRFNLVEFEQTVSRLREQLRKLEMETEAQILSRFQRESEQSGNTEFDPLELDRFSTLQQLSRALAESVSDLVSIQNLLDDIARQSETLLLQQSRVSSDLQEGLMRTRMVPFESLVPRLRRILRQTAAELGKKAQLKVEGTQGEMDRTVLERMTAPFEHMLRNSLAHGIESPEARVAKGKPEEGTVSIRVSREATEVLIQVIDDGSGMNRDAIRRKAIERGLMTPDAQLSDRDIFQFVLEAGFSTASVVSKVAGRGVGMDVVASEVKQLGGSLELDSETGQNTRITIRLPFTLAVAQAVMVKLGDASYAIPMSSITGVTRMPRKELDRRLEQKQLDVIYGGETYQIYDLGDLLRSPVSHGIDELQVPMLMSKTGDQRAAVRVTQVIGSKEVVVKSAGVHLSVVPGIFGATIMGDGRVVVILDLAPLVRHGVALRQAPELAAALELMEPIPEPAARRQPLVMVVDDSITMRKVTTRVLERSNFDVFTAKDGLDAVEQLQDRVPDVILLDIEMPRMDGYEVATYIRNDQRLKHIPIIMITSRTGEKHRQRALEVGVDRYLGKPYQETDLLKNVQEALTAGHANVH